MGSSPRMLAGFVQASLDSIDDLDRELGRAIRDRLKPETLGAVEVASATSLVSVDLDVELTECFFEVAGRERALRAFRDNLLQSVDKPLLRPLVDGAFALFGRSLVKVLRWSPRVWELIYRDAGHLVVEAAEPGRVRLRLEDMPLVMAGSPNYLIGSAETFAGVFEVAGVRGEVDLIGPDLASRSAVFELTWST